MTSPQERERMVSVEAERVVAALSPEDRELFASVDLAIDIEAWLKMNPVGRFFANVCEIEREDAMTALVECLNSDPTLTSNQVEIAKQHRRIQLCDQFRHWMLDAIEVGREAERLLKEREHTD